MREAADLLIEPRWLLPIAPLNTVLSGQAVAVSGGRILAVGPAAELHARFAPRQHAVRAQHALLPGLVNAHTSACHTLLRGLQVRGPRLRWLSGHLAPLEQRVLSADFVRDGTRLAIAEMLRAGVTCYADLSPLPAEAARAAAAAQMRALIALPVAEAASAWAEDANAYLARAEALWDEYRGDPRIGLYFAPLPAQGVSDATLTRVRRVADELDARIALQLAELASPAGYARDGREPSGAPGVEDGAPSPHPGGSALRALGRLQALGLLRPGFSAIGALECQVTESQLLTRHGASLIACPQAELRLRAAPAPLNAPAAEWSALGTDTPAAVGALDVLAEVRTAALLSGGAALEALRLATLGGATALGLATQIGSIEPGKAADLVCIDLDIPGCRPAPDAAAAIVFGATRHQVSDVWTAGRTAVSGGRLLAFDEGELAELPARWAQRLALEAAA
jgi:5-methylthioadenosine/S-adenosylhomocysteine deaminase